MIASSTLQINSVWENKKQKPITAKKLHPTKRAPVEKSSEEDTQIELTDTDHGCGDSSEDVRLHK